ncbi:MAG TPA: DUF1501 domain-containing protein [Gemmataceae bacterium]|nr:DUF1501 domain-containing protein [Gemmataceae bacterium]
MLEVNGPAYRCCDGVTRRSFLRVGFLGLAGLTLADHLRLRAAAADAGRPTRDTAVILLWLGGGPSHLDTYDLKPEAPVEFRGEFKPIPTNVPGIRVGEHLPLQARHMDKMAVVRSAFHTNAGHGMGTHWMMTGYVPTIEINDNLNPSCGSVVAKMRGANAPRLPAYVCLPNPPPSANAAYLGVAYNPFAPGDDPNNPGFRVRDLQLPPRIDLGRFKNRRELLAGLDNLRRDVDTQGTAEGYDRFYRDAFDIVTSADCRRAFEVQQEDPKMRDRYGRDSWGQSTLLARRLVEAGVTYVTVNMGGWDTHSNNFNELKTRLLPRYDRALAALLEDLHDRGLSQRVLVMTYGEFGRTPRINPQAGRDHWPGAMSVVFAGGGLKMGQVVGSTDPKAEAPKTRAVGPQDLLATMYHVLGIDYRHEFYDAARRPIAILNEGQPIEELI